MRIAFIVVLLTGAGDQVVAQSHRDATVLTLDANGNQAALGKK